MSEYPDQSVGPSEKSNTAASRAREAAEGCLQGLCPCLFDSQITPPNVDPDFNAGRGLTTLTNINTVTNSRW